MGKMENGKEATLNGSSCLDGFVTKIGRENWRDKAGSP
jgi:hypothetical protein